MMEIKLFTNDTHITYRQALRNAINVLEMFTDVQRHFIDCREVPRRNLTAAHMNIFTKFTGIGWGFKSFDTIHLTDENGNTVDIITINDLLNELKGEL